MFHNKLSNTMDKLIAMCLTIENTFSDRGFCSVHLHQHRSSLHIRLLQFATRFFCVASLNFDTYFHTSYACIDVLVKSASIPCVLRDLSLLGYLHAHAHARVYIPPQVLKNNLLTDFLDSLCNFRIFVCLMHTLVIGFGLQKQRPISYLI